MTEFLSDHDEGDKLSTFLNTMEKFNNGTPLNETLSKQII